MVTKVMVVIKVIVMVGCGEGGDRVTKVMVVCSEGGVSGDK